MPRAPMPRRRSSGRICCSKLRQVPSRQLSGSWTVPNGFSCAKQNLLKSVLSLSDAGDREVPAVEVELLPGRENPPLGVGETAQGPTAAAIGNALCDALGVRVRTLPLTEQQIIAAMPD